MRTVTKVYSEVEDVKFGYRDETGEWRSLPLAEEDVSIPAKALGCSEELLSSLMEWLGDLQEAISSDLRDIWQRLDEMEVDYLNLIVDE